MKLVGIIFCMCLFVAVVNAQEISRTIVTDEPVAGSTIQIVFTVNETLGKDIKTKDIALFHEGQEIGFTPFFSQLDEKYLLFFNLPNDKVGRFETHIQNMLFVDNGVLKETNYVIPFTVIEKEYALAFYPALVRYDRNTLAIKVKNNGKTTEVTINASEIITHPYTTPQGIQKNTERTFTFTIDEPSKNDKESIDFTYEGATFKVMVYFIKEESNGENDNTSDDNADGGIPREEEDVFILVTPVEKIEKEIVIAQVVEGDLEIENIANKEITVKTSVTGSLEDITTVDESKKIQAGSKEKIHVKINGDKNAKEKEYSGSITFESDNQKIIIPVIIKVKDEITDEDEVVEIVTVPAEKGKKPAQSEGDLSSEFFNFSVVPAEIPQEKKSEGVFVIIILVLVLGAVGLYISKKRVKQKVSFSGYIKDIEKKKRK